MREHYRDGNDIPKVPGYIDDVPRLSRSSDDAHEMLVHIIAVEMDRPSIYMGGPSKSSRRKAENAAERIEARWRETPMGVLFTPILSAKLDDMQLHDDTGDPRDEGYMAAVDELRRWLRHGDECND